MASALLEIEYFPPLHNQEPHHSHQLGEGDETNLHRLAHRAGAVRSDALQVPLTIRLRRLLRQRIEIRRGPTYIANQEEHHAKHTFQDEYRRFLQAHRIEWDEKFVWD